MCAASSSTTRSGRVERAARPGGLANACGEDLLGQGGEVAPQPALVVGRRAEVQRVGPAEQPVRVERAVGRRAGRRVGEGGASTSRPWCTPSSACARRGTRWPGPHGAPRGRRPPPGCPPPRRPPGCPPSARRRPWCDRPPRRRREGASSLAAVAYQNSPSARRCRRLLAARPDRRPCGRPRATRRSR
jgi:hypothetical protein